MTEINKEKLKALQLTMDKLEKTYGKGAVMKLGDSAVEAMEVIPSGSLGLDLALGIGGFPKGRIVEIYGPESSGKTTLAIHAIAECQKMGGIAAIIDAEHAFDKFYAEALGVDTQNLLISQPDDGEQALEIADNLIRSGAIASPIGSIMFLFLFKVSILPFQITQSRKLSLRILGNNKVFPLSNIVWFKPLVSGSSP